MIFWAWEREDCSVYSLRITSTTVIPLQSCVWGCLSAIWRSFCVVLRLSTKHGFTVVHQRPRNCQNSGLHPANVFQRRQRLPIGRKGDGHRFLEFTRCVLHRLPGENQNGQRALLCRIIGPIRRKLKKKRPHLSKKKALFHIYVTRSHQHTSAVAMTKLGYELLHHTPYSPDLVPCDLFLYQCKLEKVTRWAKVSRSSWRPTL